MSLTPSQKEDIVEMWYAGMKPYHIWLRLETNVKKPDVYKLIEKIQRHGRDEEPRGT